MEKIPSPKGRDVVKNELKEIIESLNAKKGVLPNTVENIATMETQEVLQESKRKVPVINRRVMPTWTQVTPQENSEPEVNPEPEDDELLPLVEEIPEQVQKTEVVKILEENYNKTRIEIAHSLFDRAILNDDIAIAFTQYNILRTQTNQDTEDLKWQLENLIKKISLEEKKKYETALATIPPEDPKRLVATRRRSLIDDSLGKYKEALKNNEETVELPPVLQELPVDQYPKTVDTNLKEKLQNQRTTDVQREMLPHIFNSALRRKDYLIAYNQLEQTKKVFPEMYVEYTARMMEALENEIAELEKSIIAEKEKTKKTLMKKIWESFMKTPAEPENIVIKTSEQKLAQFRNLKESL